MAFNLRNIVNDLLHLGGPLTGVLADTLLPKRLAAATGQDEGLVSKVLDALRTDPQALQVERDFQIKMRELDLEEQRITVQLQQQVGEVMTGLDQRSAADPKWVQLVRGLVRPLGVAAAVATFVLVVLVAFFGGVVFNVIPLNGDKLALMQMLLDADWKLTVFLGGAYTVARSLWDKRQV